MRRNRSAEFWGAPSQRRTKIETQGGPTACASLLMCGGQTTDEAATNKHQTNNKRINSATCGINYWMHKRCDMIAVLQMKRAPQSRQRVFDFRLFEVEALRLKFPDDRSGSSRPLGLVHALAAVIRIEVAFLF
jgi:hypothetical protein